MDKQGKLKLEPSFSVHHPPYKLGNHAASHGLRHPFGTPVQAWTRRPHLPPDFHGLLVVGAEEVIGAVMLHRFAAILSHVENCGKGKHRQKQERASAQLDSAVQFLQITLSSNGPRSDIFRAKGSGTSLGLQSQREPGLQQKQWEDMDIWPMGSWKDPPPLPPTPQGTELLEQLLRTRPHAFPRQPARASPFVGTPIQLR